MTEIKNNTTLKWVGIIVAILLGIGGWFWAGTQLPGLQRLAQVETELRSSRILLADMTLRLGILQDQVVRLRGDIVDLRAEIKRLTQ